MPASFNQSEQTRPYLTVTSFDQIPVAMLVFMVRHTLWTEINTEVTLRRDFFANGCVQPYAGKLAPVSQASQSEIKVLAALKVVKRIPYDVNHWGAVCKICQTYRLNRENTDAILAAIFEEKE